MNAVTRKFAVRTETFSGRSTTGKEREHLHSDDVFALELYFELCASLFGVHAFAMRDGGGVDRWSMESPALNLIVNKSKESRNLRRTHNVMITMQPRCRAVLYRVYGPKVLARSRDEWQWFGKSLAQIARYAPNVLEKARETADAESRNASDRVRDFWEAELAESMAMPIRLAEEIESPATGIDRLADIVDECLTAARRFDRIESIARVRASEGPKRLPPDIERACIDVWKSKIGRAKTLEQCGEMMRDACLDYLRAKDEARRCSTS